ncbi:hypothetical protein VTO73DRAFT_11558 [Trametes versicolor]
MDSSSTASFKPKHVAIMSEFGAPAPVPEWGGYYVSPIAVDRTRQLIGDDLDPYGLSKDPSYYPQIPKRMSQHMAPHPHTPQASRGSLPGIPMSPQGQNPTPPKSPGVLAPDARQSHFTPSPHVPSTLCNISSNPDAVPSSTAPFNDRRVLNPNASSFTPKRIIIKSDSGREIDLEPFRVKKEPRVPYWSIPLSMPARPTVSVRIESEDARRKRMAEEERLPQETENRARQCKIAEVEAYEEDGEPMGEEAQKKTPTAVSVATKRLSPSHTKINIISAPLPSALATARMIKDIGTIVYPEGILGPKPELNRNTEPGKFRYDRDFLLQFMAVCKEKPDFLIPHDVFGLEPRKHVFVAPPRLPAAPQRGRNRVPLSTAAHCPSNVLSQTPVQKNAGGPATRQSPKAGGDSSNFGGIGESTPVTFGPSSVFQKNKTKIRESTLSRQGSTSIQSMPGATPEIAAEVTAGPKL